MIQLYSIKTNKLVAEFDDSYNIKKLHPLFKNEVQKGVALPIIGNLTEQFGGSKVTPDSPLFGRAVIIYLSTTYASDPESYKWTTGEELVKKLFT